MIRTTGATHAVQGSQTGPIASGHKIMCRPDTVGDFTEMDSTSGNFSGRIARPSRQPRHPALFYTGHRFPPIDTHNPQPDQESPDEQDAYEVRIIDNDFNTYQEVMDITRLALNITEEQAYAVAWEVDHRGSCVVAYGPCARAEEIAEMIRTIGIEVQVNPRVPGRS